MPTHHPVPTPVQARRKTKKTATMVVPPPPKGPLPRRPAAKDLLGRTFYDEDHFGYDGEVEFEGGEFVAQRLMTGGYVDTYPPVKSVFARRIRPNQRNIR